MTYKITDYSYQQAKKLNVEIKPSSNKKKKIDVFKNDKKIASIGSISYNDYPTFIITLGFLRTAQSDNFGARLGQKVRGARKGPEKGIKGQI